MKKKRKAEDMTANGSCQTYDEQFVMTPDHPAWEEFYERLSGPEESKSQEHPTGDLASTCDGSIKRPRATKILHEMGADVEASLDYFAAQGGYCDCEIILNVDGGW